MTPLEIEQAAFEKDEVRIVIRAPMNKQLGSYNFARKAAGSATITEFLEARIKPLLRANEVTVVDGNGVYPHGRTKMSTVRGSYAK